MFKMDNSSKDITDLSKLIKIIIEENENYDGQLWWRGQRDYKDKLIPGVYRGDYKKKRETYYEQNIIDRFKLLAKVRHNDVPQDDDQAKWLVLMQHYGLPTRLLDWTESPLIACYFAIENNNKNDGALYLLQPRKINRLSLDDNSNLPESESDFISIENIKVKAIINQAFTSNTDRQPDENIYAIRPPQFDNRMMVQLSTFTVHGTSIAIDNPASKYVKFCKKFNIPANYKIKIRNQLKQLGIREYNIFPDLEHLSDEISKMGFMKNPT